jgi:hypothetical protein
VEPRLPPPDPHESLGLTPDVEIGIAEPTAVFATGPPNGDVEQLAESILDFRPGMLFVFARD